MRISDIRLRDTNCTRTDGRYPLCIGSEVEFYSQPIIGMPMFLSYIKDNKGNPKSGILCTSPVTNIIENDEKIVVITFNSEYWFEK